MLPSPFSPVTAENIYYQQPRIDPNSHEHQYPAPKGLPGGVWITDCSFTQFSTGDEIHLLSFLNKGDDARNRSRSHDLRVHGEAFSCPSVGIRFHLAFHRVSCRSPRVVKILHGASRFDTFLTTDQCLSEVASENLAGCSEVLKVTFDALFIHLYPSYQTQLPAAALESQKVFIKSSLSYLPALWVCLEHQCCTRWLCWTSWDKLQISAYSNGNFNSHVNSYTKMP